MAKNCRSNIIIPDKYSVVVVQNLTERNNISCKLRQNGMIAIIVEEEYTQYQIQTQEGIYSVCNNNAWVQIETGGGVINNNNLIIINNEQDKQEYLLSGTGVVGQMIFFVPEEKYYTYNGNNLEDPFPNKLEVSTETISAPDSVFKYAYIFDDNNIPRRMLAGDLGKNIANSSLTSVNGAGMTQGADYTWNTARFYWSITNLSDVSDDSRYNNWLVQDPSGRIAKSNGKPLIVGMPSLLSEEEKTTWKTAMNVGNDTLESVVQRGNYTPKPIKFGDSASPFYFGINKNNYNIRFSETDVESDAGTGNSNIGIGFQTLLNLTSGSYNISIGGWAGRGLTTGTYNTILGSVAGYALSTGEYNLFVGAQSGRNSTTGNSNTFVGESAGFGNTTGFKNVFVGTAVAYQSTTGNLNTLIGYKAGTGSVLGDRNTFIGSGAGQNTSGSNNVFIGVGAGGNDGAISNKLIIHSNHTLSGYTNTSEGAYSSFQHSTLSMALITGDFVERWFKLNGTFKVANGYMAEVGGNAAFSRVAMYNPTTGDFGKANILDLPFIPLSGTTAGKPVTGKIEFSIDGGGTIESGVAKLSLTDGYIQLVSGALKGVYISPGQTMLRHGDLKYINLSDEFDYISISAETDGPGLVSPYYYGDQYVEKSFIQKKYSDSQHSFTTSEILTQGTWIDGKPVYQITLELTNIPSSGIVNLTGLVPGISRIVASDVFTEWSSLSLVFAGQVYRNDDVNVSINITPLELRIKNFITDGGYELIDRILLTIQYTKTGD